ncbi:MAG: DNA-directed RNA polymerase subunit P [Candidatus Aenigmatarchaeota archaeon]|nr:MAG: DNA-directed RNA polymerase subunit P [Candidatus Aenigmarchaeota archaeon]
MPYKCLSCRKEISTEDVKKRVRCPYCGYRILVKTRAAVKTVHLKTG